MSEKFSNYNPETTVETKETRENRTVARVFVAQSRSTEFVELALAKAKKAGKPLVEAIGELHLTDVLWLEKGADARNAGQLMPIGGGQKEGDKDLFATAARELLEETHLRPISLDLLCDRSNDPLSVSYEMTLKNKGEPDKVIENTQHFLFCKILPSDCPYPLDPVEDKVAAFHGLDIESMGALWSGAGAVKSNDGQLFSLLDSLQIAPQSVENEKIKVNFPDQEEHGKTIWSLMDSLGQKARGLEIEKNISVTTELLNITEQPPEITADILQKLNAVKNSLPEVRIVYQAFLRGLKGVKNLEVKFIRALERSNTREELRFPGNSQIEAAIRLAFLLSDGSLSLDEYAALVQSELENRDQNNVSPEINDLFLAIERISGRVQWEKEKQGLSDDGAVKAITKKHSLSAVKNLPKATVERIFAEEVGVENTGEKLARIQKFIQNMVEQGLMRGSVDKLDEATVSPLTNIAHSDIRALMAYAFDTNNLEIKLRFNSVAARKRLRFEALRTLFLLLALEPVNREYQTVMKTGHYEVEELWQDLLLVDETSRKLKTSERLVDNEQNEREKFTRRFIDIPGLFVMQAARVKQVDSLYRKVIVRGFDDPSEVRDIYGRTLILTANNPADGARLFARETRPVTVYEIGEKNSLLPREMMVDDMVAVHSIIARLEAGGAKIVDYEPTNKPGESFKSAGPGGGAKICLGKFYICLENKNPAGVVERRFEEVQIFSPTEDGVSGFAHKRNKEQDDHKYGISRLTDTKGLRSFIELLFPAKIYGDPMHAPYQGKKKK